jgi:hypothetical protein
VSASVAQVSRMQDGQVSGISPIFHVRRVPPHIDSLLFFSNLMERDDMINLGLGDVGLTPTPVPMAGTTGSGSQPPPPPSRPS